MGFESFQIVLAGDRATFAVADAAVRRRRGARPDPDGGFHRGPSYYAVDVGQHVFEVEVEPAGVGARVSCRFALCHPASVGEAFLGFVGGLATELGMTVRICDDVSPGQRRVFAPPESAELAEVALACIARRRAEWVAMFGPETLAGTTREQFEHIVLPRCVPGAAPTT